jgi:hypothetical protein
MNNMPQISTVKTLTPCATRLQRLCASRDRPRLRSTDQFPWTCAAQDGDLGVLGIWVKSFGGANMGYLAHSYHDLRASVSLSYGAHSNLCVKTRSTMARPSGVPNTCTN